MKAPITDKTLGIANPYGSDNRFRDVRTKAKDEEVTRHKKARRDKNKTKFPKYKIDDLVMLASINYKSSGRYYHLVQVIDVEEMYHGFGYFGILKRTTEPKRVSRIGRLIKFAEIGWWSGDPTPALVAPDSIKNWTFIDGE